MALEIYNEKLDAGYNYSHSNCEHFVTFCLTRHGYFSASRQVLAVTIVKDAALFFGCTIILLAKAIAGPDFFIKGVNDLLLRLPKTILPTEFDSEIVNEIKNNSKIYIGNSIFSKWFPHD